MTSKGRTPSSTRNVRYDRLAFPVGACWTAAVRSGQVSEAHRTLENVLRFMTSLVLGDVLDLEWTPRVEALLVAGAEAGGLEGMTMGRRVEFLRELVKLHAAAPEDGPERVLPPLDAWWEDVRKDLDGGITERNEDVHGIAGRGDSLEAALDRLARVLRQSKWLQEVQLVTVETASRRMGVSKGQVQRLVGVAPFDDPKHRFEATWRADFSDGFVQVGSADGKRWMLCPFLAAEPRGVALMDAITRKGEFVFGDPLAAPGTPQPVGRGIPSPDGELRWTAFLKVRKELAPEFRFVEASPHSLLVMPPPAAHRLEPGARLGDDYRLVRLIGEGGMASVWEAEDVHTKAKCALKVPKPEMADTEFEARFKREIDLLKRLHAEGVRRILGPVERLRIEVDDEPLTVLRMPLLRATLADRLKALQAKKQLPEAEQVAKWGEQALEALTDLHAKEIVHRDVKPSNLLLDANDEVVLGDFGIARDNASDAHLTRTRAGMGSEFYMAPEQLHDAKRVTGKADVFALAVSLHELVKGKTSEAPGKGISGDFGSIVTQMGKREAEERPSAEEALKKLVEMREVEPPGRPMEYVRIEPGEFWMGASEGDEYTFDNGKPRHKVRITRPFLMMSTPVTQGLYEAVMGTNPSGRKGRDDRPVEWVSWYDAVRFCNALSRRDGLPEAYEVVEPEGEGEPKVTWRGFENNGWRLPTEAEWEYACRAGTDTPRYGELDEIAWYGDNSKDRTHAVGLKKPNAWGLYDMLGNVWEWVFDTYSDKYWDETAALDPEGKVVWNDAGEAALAFGKHKGRTLRELAAQQPEYLRFLAEDEDSFSEAVRRMAAEALEGVYRAQADASIDPVSHIEYRRVLRGGGFGRVAAVVRSSCRDWNFPGITLGNLGFRCARGTGG